MEDNSKKNELFIIFNSGSVFVNETLDQINFLVAMLDIKDKNIKTIERRTVTSSIIIFLSNLLEGYANFLITLIINIDNGKLKAPKVYRHLSETEILALTERSKVFDPGTGKEVIREKTYMRTRDKIRIAPFLLEGLYNENAKLMDKGSKEFQQLIKLQELRDSFMHIKHDIHLLPQNPVHEFEYHINNFTNLSNYNIEDKDIFESMSAVAWYLHKQFTLIRKLFHVDKLSLDMMESKLMFIQISLNKALKLRKLDKYAIELYTQRMACIKDFIVGAMDDNSGMSIQLNRNENVRSK